MAISEAPTPATSSPPPDPRVETEIYRPFFLAGILAVLTAGCLLGAVALFGIAQAGNYIATGWTPYILAHANSQLYGWVGFFVIGFALQQHAPRRSRVRLFHRLARWSLILMAMGIGLRFAAEPLVRVDPSLWIPVGVFACVLQALAVMIFMATIGLTRFRTGEALTWQVGLVFSSLFWWLIVAVAEPVVFARSHAPDGVLFVARWFAPYREAQFFGFVTMMIFGVALVRMSDWFGAQPANPILGFGGFLIWNLGLCSRILGWLIYFDSGFERPTLWFAGGVLLATGAAFLIASSRMFGALAGRLRSHKFIRAAFVWLLVSGVLLALEPLHLSLTGRPFSHPFTGAVRHALTVGFISQMIIGVSSHVVARMIGLTGRLDPLWPTFWLLNGGNALRVGLEIATDYSPRAFPWMGVTGFIELVGIALWAIEIARPMLRRRTLSHAR